MSERTTPARPLLAPVLARLYTLGAFIRYTLVRFAVEGCLTGAGALSYTTLVSLVPLTAIALAVLSAFPIFASMRDQLLATLFLNFVPEVGAEVEWWFRYFAGTSVRTTTIGVLVLLLTVIFLLATIEEQLHAIWRVKSPRPWLQRVLAYWAILTLGPILVGVSFSLPNYLDLFARRSGIGIDPDLLMQEQWFHDLLRVVPFVLETVAFTLVYQLIPNCSVRWREAFVGALVAAALFEGLKVGFAAYVAYLSSYRAVYGALAAIPIFLLWMYVAWGLVLFGAVVAASLPQWRIDEHGGAGPPDVAAQRLGLALALLAELAEQTHHGGTLPLPELADRLGVATTAVDDDLTLLHRAGFVAAAANGGWVLARALDGTSLLDLYRALRLPLAGTLQEIDAYPWHARIAGAVQRIAAAETEALSLSLGDLVGGGPHLAGQVTPHPLSRRR
jgi:membrane protein